MSFPSLKIGDLVAKTPIVQGGMGVGISLSRLASAVANEGGIGVIGVMERRVRIPSGRQGSCPAAERAAATGCVREIMGAPEKNLHIKW